MRAILKHDNFLSKDQPLHSHHRSGDHNSGQKNPRRYGRKGGPEAKAHQKGNGAAGPGSGHGQRYGYEDGQGGEAEALVLPDVLFSGAGEEPGEKPIPERESPQPVGDWSQKEEQGDHRQKVSQNG